MKNEIFEQVYWFDWYKYYIAKNISFYSSLVFGYFPLMKYYPVKIPQEYLSSFIGSKESDMDIFKLSSKKLWKRAFSKIAGWF